MIILAYREAEFLKKIATFNRKAGKMNLPLISAVEASRGTVKHHSTYVNELGETLPKVTELETIEYNIVGDIPKLGGWAVHSRVEPVAELVGENYVYTAPQFAPEPRLRTTSMICEHCNMKRGRSLVYLMQNVDTGEQKIVGKSCLKDFLPNVSVENLLSYMASFPTAEPFNDEDFNNAPRSAHVYPIDSAIAESLVIIGKIGFVSAKAAREAYENGDFGASATSNFLANNDPKFCKAMFGNGELKEVIDSGKLAAVKEFVSAMNPSSDFAYNLQLCFKATNVPYKMFGFVAAAVNMYLRSVEEKLAKETSTASNEFLGVISERVVFTNLKMVRRFAMQGNYGTSYILGFEDEAGNSVVWFSSVDIGDVGEVFTLKATIKGHDVYKGRKQTVITRAKVQ
jgi:hypothetical protein